MKLEEQNNFVFGIAIWEHSRIYNLWSAAVCCVCCYHKSCKIHKYIASSPVRSFNNLNRLVERRFCLLFGTKSLYFKNKKRDEFNLPCNFLTYSIRLVWESQWIVSARNSQMASSLSLVRVLCSTLTMSSFPLEIGKNILAMKISRILH